MEKLINIFSILPAEISSIPIPVTGLVNLSKDILLLILITIFTITIFKISYSYYLKRTENSVTNIEKQNNKIKKSLKYGITSFFITGSIFVTISTLFS